MCCAGAQVGTFALLKSFLPAKCNIHTTFVDISDLSAIYAAMTSKTKACSTPAPSTCTTTPHLEGMYGNDNGVVCGC